MTHQPIRFYLDFVSTYSYFAAHRIEKICAEYDRLVDWRIVSLPHIFKATGTVSPLAQPLKLAHNHQDILRLVGITGLPFIRPPVVAPDVQWARLVFYKLRAINPTEANRFAFNALNLRFGHGRELNTLDTLVQAALGLSITAKDIEATREDFGAKAALVAMADTAIVDGMFGAPFVRADEEKFWGHDRTTDHLQWWLSRKDHSMKT